MSQSDGTGWPAWKWYVWPEWWCITEDWLNPGWRTRR